MMTALLKRLDPAIAVLMIEHDMAVAFEVVDRLTVLHYGRVLADGSAGDVRANPTVQEIYLGTLELR
jgi:branched-chain amino acid transport system ATP-binding protein